MINCKNYYVASVGFSASCLIQTLFIIGAVEGANEVDLSSRVEEILSIGRVVYAYPVLITMNRKSSNLDLSCFCLDELSVLRSPEELIASA